MITFSVVGHAQPQGSTKAFMPKGARYPVVTSDNPNLKQWRQLVAVAAQPHAVGGPLRGGVFVVLTFSLQRPKSLPKHVREHLKKPDIDKLARAVLDALTGILFVDDSEVIRLTVKKQYAAPHQPPGVLISIGPCAEAACTPLAPPSAPREVGLLG